MKKYGIIILAILISYSPVTFTQISITATGTYSQDFNALADTGSSSILPVNWYLNESGSNADNQYTAGTGSSTGGDTYSFGSEESQERALGGVGAASLIPSFGAHLINSTGETINLLHISYTGEQWRVGATDRIEPDKLDFQYSLDAASLSDGNWIDVDLLDFSSPVLNTNSGARDGNLPENQRSISYAITGLSIPDGSEFWIKWIDENISGSDDGLAIDDLEIDLNPPLIIQGGELQFKCQARDLLCGTSGNQDTIVLNNYTGQPLKALQFNLLIGKTNGGLILNSVSGGNAIPADNFSFDYEIYPGDILPDNSSIDTVKIVILGNDANAILPESGNQDILYFTYDIVDIADESIQTFNHLTAVKGATISPVVDAGLTSGSDETINILGHPPENLLGDINFDKEVDILDLLIMIDCILGRIQFDSEQMQNSDIFPWDDEDELPSPDGIINVLDLAVLQHLVLTGNYPNGTTLPKSINSFLSATRLHKSGANAKIILHLTDKGIMVKFKSAEKIKGLQLDLNQVTTQISENTEVTSAFNQTLYHQENSFLRILSYDDESVPLNPGEYLIAAIPFNLKNPENIIVENIIIADENNHALNNFELEIDFKESKIPLKYMLNQNYPNPFNPYTNIEFAVPQDEFVQVRVYDMIGQEVATLYSGETKAGFYNLRWDAVDNNKKHVSSGIYIYRMTAGKFTQSKKMLLIK